MSDDEHRRLGEDREDLLTAAVRVLLAERNWDPDAVPKDDEYEAKDALALAARTYVEALNASGTHLWQATDVESLRVQVRKLTEERDFLQGQANRQTRIVSIFVKHHTTIDPLPEDVRNEVLAVMDGTAKDEVHD